jgi:2-polyprenyl-3-methyl-5-hydroxy-6-metoxy-1,4-benzoquinol methylase
MDTKYEIPQFEYGLYADASKECFQQFGSIFSLPIIYNVTGEIIACYSKGNVLDIGCGKEKLLQSAFNDKLLDGEYYSLDNDPQGEFDFTDVNDIPLTLRFSLVTANQLFEHLTIDRSIELMCTACQHLLPGGKIVATIPNISHPNRYVTNVTHTTPWGYNNFNMLFKYANLKVTNIYRYSKRHPQGIMEKLIAKYVARVYRMDWCDSIMLIAEK